MAASEAWNVLSAEAFPARRSKDSRMLRRRRTAPSTGRKLPRVDPDPGRDGDPRGPIRTAGLGDRAGTGVRPRAVRVRQVPVVNDVPRGAVVPRVPRGEAGTAGPEIRARWKAGAASLAARAQPLMAGDPAGENPVLRKVAGSSVPSIAPGRRRMRSSPRFHGAAGASPSRDAASPDRGASFRQAEVVPAHGVRGRVDPWGPAASARPPNRS